MSDNRPEITDNGVDANGCHPLPSGSALSTDKIQKILDEIDLDELSIRVAEHMADLSERYRQANIVSAIENMNLHITALASCSSVAAGMARLKAEEDRRALIANLVSVPNTDRSGASSRPAGGDCSEVQP